MGDGLVLAQSATHPASRIPHPRRRLSQSFLQDERIAAAIVGAAELRPGQEDVLEVGPGLGALSHHLAHLARHLVAVEIDAQLAERLRADLSAPNVTICTADILRTDPASLFDGPFVVVANLPYHITSPLLRHLLGAGPPGAARLVVMVQAEVGERLLAAPGQLSALGVAIQAQARVSRVRSVPPSAFRPRPKVDSVVLRLDPLGDEQRLVGRGELVRFVRLVQAGFKQPRKQLGNSLAEGLGRPKPEVLPVLQAAALDPSQRPQQLTLDDWVRLFRTVEPR